MVFIINYYNRDNSGQLGGAITALGIDTQIINSIFENNTARYLFLFFFSLLLVLPFCAYINKKDINNNGIY